MGCCIEVVDIAILLGLIFFLFCLIFVMYHSYHIKRLTLLDWSVIGLGGVYGIGLSIVIGVTWAGGNPNWENWIMPYTNYYLLHTFFAFVLAFAIYLGWLIGGSLCFLKKSQKSTFFNSKIYDNRLYILMWCLLVIAIITQWLYTLAYGGLIGVLEYSRLIRSGIFLVENKLSFLRPFGGLAFFASFGFFGLWLSGYRRMGVRLGFCFSLFFSIYVLYSWMWRMGFVIYFGTFIFSLFFSRRSIFLSLVRGCFILLIMLISTYYISIYLNLKPADNIMTFLSKELSFPFVSFFAQIDYGQNLYRFFYDILLAPLYLLPSSIWSNWIENVSEVNTALIMGAPKGQQSVTGAIPVDLLTLGLMQMSVFGIPFVGLIYGLLLRLFQLMIDSIPNIKLKSISEAYIAIKIAVYGIFYANPSNFVSENFPLWFTIFIIWVFIRFPRIQWYGKFYKKNVLL